MNKRSNAKTVAFLGVMFALIFVFLLVETYVFSAFFGAFTPCALTLPLAIALSLSGSKKPMVIGGTLLGCASFLLAIFISNPIFINPLISILPRLFIGVVAYGVYFLLKKACASSKNTFVKEILPCAVAGVFGTLSNSVCTIFMMWVFSAAELAAVFTTIISINFVAEVVASAVLVPIYVRVINKIVKKG
ncbi:MAG: hypothetical protein IJE56_00565 [Clostridia bacterium]|nr:hypothetical protein [Clostridia bacterium]